MSDEDYELFLKEMADVARLNAAGQGAVRPQRAAPTPGQMYRREAAMRTRDMDQNQLPTAFVDYVHPEAVLSFKRDGIQNGVFRRLQQGAYEIEAMLDLHGLTIEQARGEVFRFIRDCIRHDVRSALISHGKGRNNKDGLPLLKSFLARWLPMFSEIMAFHSAQKWHGGTGAVYLLLRKSEKAKEETREKLGLSSGKPVP
jgi:DNA-nicking Smr family endonuclease